VRAARDRAVAGPRYAAPMTVEAKYHDTVIARSDRTVVVEGNHYFPLDDVDTAFLVESDSHTTCPWKGLASYYDVSVDGSRAVDAAWYYPDPKDAAKEITGHVAFWRGVEVVENS
jgi:uncharacterized protein (DUF427 family)